MNMQQTEKYDLTYLRPLIASCSVSPFYSLHLCEEPQVES